MYISSPFFDLIDVVCLRGHWTLEITRLGLVGGGAASGYLNIMANGQVLTP